MLQLNHETKFLKNEIFHKMLNFAFNIIILYHNVSSAYIKLHIQFKKRSKLFTKCE